MANMKKETSVMVFSGSKLLNLPLIRFSNSRFAQNDE